MWIYREGYYESEETGRARQARLDAIVALYERNPLARVRALSRQTSAEVAVGLMTKEQLREEAKRREAPRQDDH